MKIHLVCYATKNFSIMQDRLIEQCKNNGIDVIHKFTDDDLKDTEYYKQNAHILDQKRGAGYWIWQPYFVNKVLNTLDENDILLYADSGLMISSNIKNLVKELNFKDAQFFFSNKFTEKQFTKRDCFILMDCDSEEYWNQKHALGGIHFWKNTQYSRQFLQHIFLYVLDERIATDMENRMELPNFEEFKDHRHLQSIISLLTRKLNAPIRDVEVIRPYIKSKGDPSNEVVLVNPDDTNIMGKIRKIKAKISRKLNK